MLVLKPKKLLNTLDSCLELYSDFTDYVRKNKKPRNLAAIKYKNVLCQRIPAKKINDLAANFLYVG